MREWRKSNPKRAAYCSLRDHAKERGIEVLLTYEEFCQVIEGTEYIEKSGRRKHELQLDRIDATKPYMLGNLQVVTCSENAGKSNYERWTPEHKQHMAERRKTEDSNTPF